MPETKGFDDFKPLFVEATAELEDGDTFGGVSRPFFLVYIHPKDSSHLVIIVSDFHSKIFERDLTVMDIDDLRDETGIGGSWNDFVHYFLASLSAGDVKLIVDASENLRADSSVADAKLITRKSKGLPRISLPLNGLVDLAAKTATASISLALFNAYKNKHHDLVKGQEHLSRLTEMLASERDMNKTLQHQLNALSFSNKRKVSNVLGSEKAPLVFDDIGTKELVISEADQTSASNTSLVKTPSRVAGPLKGSQRAVPAHRRAKARGVSLRDNEDDDDGS